MENPYNFRGYHIAELCREKGWCTQGSQEQYEKMLKAVDRGEGIHDIAIMIWMMSKEVTRKEIRNEMMQLDFRMKGYNPLEEDTFYL